MSKRFKTQDYHRFKRLGIRWRKANGRQSKLRVNKAGSGAKPAVGYGTAAAVRNTVRGMSVVLVRHAKDLPATGAVILASALGARATHALAATAKSRGLVILNMKKVHAAARLHAALAKRREATKTEQKKKEAKMAQQTVEKKEATRGSGASEVSEPTNKK